MSKMGDEHARLMEIADHGDDDEKIREFGSVQAAHDWHAEQERMQGQADAVDPEGWPDNDLKDGDIIETPYPDSGDDQYKS